MKFKKFLVSAISVAAMIGVMAFGVNASEAGKPSTTVHDLKDADVFGKNFEVSADGHSAEFKVFVNGKELVKDQDYTVTDDRRLYAAGTYTFTIQGKGAYSGTIQTTVWVTPGADGKKFAQVKAPKLQPTINGSTKAVFKAKALKKAKKTAKIKLTVNSKDKDNEIKSKVKYRVLNGKKYITVSKAGKVTVKKGTPKGKYKISVIFDGTVNFHKATKTIVIQVK